MDTSANPKYDFLIIGAGIMGLASAYEIKKRLPSASIAVLEKEPEPGLHASGRNSGVLHAGIYYPKGTLKAQICVTGAKQMRDFCEEHKIPWKRNGKVIIAKGEEEREPLKRLFENAKQNGVNVQWLDAQNIKQYEPHANDAIAGMYSPDTSVVNTRVLLQKLCALLKDKGVHFFYGQRFMQVFPRHKKARTYNNHTFHYGYLLNCGGSQADAIARKFGLCRDYVLVPFKGLYRKLRPEKNHLVQGNIYPVPDPKFPFLGVHFTKSVEGTVYVGPTAIPALGRENYGILSGMRVQESIGIFWHLANLFLKDKQNFRGLVFNEVQMYLKPNFVKAAQKLVPDIKFSDVVPCHKVGIRPQLINIKQGKMEMDFIIETTPDSLHVLNAISPAFTSAFSFAELIVNKINQN